jgi:CubicO group peptidase (beta-lactamase class C family)
MTTIKVLLVFLAIGLLNIGSGTLSYGSESESFFRLMNAYIQYDKTRIKKTKVGIHSYGDDSSLVAGQIDAPVYDKYFKDENNLAAIVMRDGKVIYERYNKDRGITADTALNGMSIAKTAAASVIGTLFCQGRIKSLDDPAKVYSSFLAQTPFAEVKIKNILQMMSGVSPSGRAFEGKLVATVLGLGRFSGKGSVKNAIKLFETAATDQGKRFNYGQLDPMALSLISQEITGEPLSQTFYTEIYSKFRQRGRLHWTSDNQNITTGFGSLTMRPKDWAGFGQYIMQQMTEKTCLGDFFSNGLKNSVPTNYPDRNYGFLSWVQDINGSPSLTFRGKGGQFIVIDPTRKLIIYIASIDYNSGLVAWRGIIAHSFGHVN